MGDDHAVQASGRSCCRRIEISVAIEPDKTDTLVVSAEARDNGHGLDAFTAKDEDQSSRLDGLLDTRPQVVQPSDDFGGISRAGMLVILGKEARGAVA